VAPPGISAAQRRRIEQAVDAMAHSVPWREALVKYRWIDRYLAGAPFEQFVNAEEARVQNILRELGTRNTDTNETLRPYPLFVLAGLFVFGAAALGGGISKSRRLRLEADPDSGNVRLQARRASGVQERHHRRSIALIAAAIVLNLLLAETAGFVIASAVLFWLTARAFDAAHPLRDAMFAAAVSLGSYLLFARVLDLPLPAGVLGSWL
jgi:hypothetical protein